MNDKTPLRELKGVGDKTEKLFQKSPEKLVKKVVKGMLPKNKLGAKQLDNLYVFEGEEHDKQAQQPKVIDINSLR